MIALLVAGQSSARAEQEFTGTYIDGPEVRTFTPCGSEHTYWVSFDWAGQTMRDFYHRHQSAPYAGLYLRFRGQLLDEEVGGFATRYDGLVRVSEVREYSFEHPPSCKRPESLTAESRSPT